MDFDGAIRAHTNWMLRLFGYAKGSSKEKLNPHVIEQDNVCDLGKWLHSEGQKLASEPEYLQLVKAHAAFHKAAGALVDMVDQGKRSAAELLLMAADSDYRQRSFQVVGLLKKLQKKYDAAR